MGKRSAAGATRTGQGPFRHRRALDDDPGRTAGGGGGRQRGERRQPRGGRGVPEVPVHAAGAGHRGAAFLSFASPASSAEIRQPVSAGEDIHHRATVRRLAQGAGKILRRRRRLRSDRARLTAGALNPARDGVAMANAKRHRVLPGFGLSVGYTLAFLGLIVLLPLAALTWKASGIGVAGLLHLLAAPRTQAALKLSFGGALAASLVNAAFGLLVAWVLVRYRFPGRRLLDAMVDLPFALPTAVAGVALTAIYAPNGWIGKPLMAWFGWKVAYNPIAVFVALVFVGLPFIMRTVPPVLQDLDAEVEEAAVTLGANDFQRWTGVVLPAVLPALITGFSLAFARAVGEYGSVIFIAGNMPMVSEIAPLLIVIKLEQFDYRGATSVAAAMLVIAFVLLLVINYLQAWGRRRGAAL